MNWIWNKLLIKELSPRDDCLAINVRLLSTEDRHIEDLQIC